MLLTRLDLELDYAKAGVVSVGFAVDKLGTIAILKETWTIIAPKTVVDLVVLSAL